MKTYGVIITIAVAIMFPVILIGIAMVCNCNKKGKGEKCSRKKRSIDTCTTPDEYMTIFKEADLGD